MEEYFERNCVMRGYHVYEEVWETAVGEASVCEREPGNTFDSSAVGESGGLQWCALWFTPSCFNYLLYK